MTTPAMRWMLLVAGAFVIIAGGQLFVLGEHTEDYFAWTVEPPITAAFLGAGYWASAILELGSARRKDWPRARLAMPAVLFFTTLTLGVTLVHLSRFHLDRVFGIAWLVVYAVFPVAMTITLVDQIRRAPASPPRCVELPGLTRAVLLAQGVVMAALGSALLTASEDARSLWPWALTPLTARAVGAWLAGVAFLAMHVLLENARERVDVALLSYAAFGVLQLVALARYPSTPDWTAAEAAAYVAFLAVMVAVGLHGYVQGRKAWNRPLTRDRGRPG